MSFLIINLLLSSKAETVKLIPAMIVAISPEPTLPKNTDMHNNFHSFATYTRSNECFVRR